MLSVYCFIILDFQSSDSYQLSGFMDPIQLPWECLCDAAEFKKTNIKIWKEKKIGVISWDILMMMKVAEIFLAVGLFVQSPVCRMHNFGNKDVINGSGFVKVSFSLQAIKEQQLRITRS